MDFLPTQQYADCDTGVTVHEKVQVRCPRGRTTVTILRGLNVIEERSGFVSAEEAGAGRWHVRFEDGTIWRTTALARPCNCGQ